MVLKFHDDPTLNESKIVVFLRQNFSSLISPTDNSHINQNTNLNCSTFSSSNHKHQLKPTTLFIYKIKDHPSTSYLNKKTTKEKFSLPQSNFQVRTFSREMKKRKILSQRGNLFSPTTPLQGNPQNS
ncbi:hypothetical protein JHK86_015837 [Glycine max]|uniref:Uncharacterized protein n=1 Tax=Glycine max TaxID=3847 RepID=A0A0R0JPF5_SOYBN|nr:hypothetical protein JHK86_015837 [Glycine max]